MHFSFFSFFRLLGLLHSQLRIFNGQIYPLFYQFPESFVNLNLFTDLINPIPPDILTGEYREASWQIRRQLG